MENLSKYKDLFLSESRELIASMNKSLLEFEKQPAEMEFVNSIFREAHTLKGMASTMNYTHTTRLCHAVEDVLDALRKKQITPNKCIDTLFESFDTLELSLKEIGKGQEESDTTLLVEKLQALSTETQQSDIEDRPLAIENQHSEIENIQSIEVKVERLNLLMNLVEELFINKMRLDQIKEDIQNPELTAAIDALGRLTAELQYNVMQARMVPMGFIFNRFPRMVRDLAKQQHKEINLEVQGSEIELDRVVIDKLGEPLVHLLRNSIDHGIESPEERKKKGKPPAGRIKLSAQRKKNFAVIEIEDDGAGLDIKEIKAAAIKRKVLSPEATPEEVMNAVFSGLSTTKEVTEVSGRGFGLNIVKSKIESLAGVVKVESEPGKGTTFSLELPLTLAIIKVLFVETGGRTYAIPLVNIERLVTVAPADIKGMMEYEAIILDEEDISLTRLNLLFDLPDRLADSPSLDKEQVVIIRKEEERLGLVVDRFRSTREIVIKPLNKLVRENRYFAGSTIIGSGEVVLILDVGNLILTERGRKERGEGRG